MDPSSAGVDWFNLTPDELALLPHDDKGPKLVATSWVLAVTSALFLGLRLYCKVTGQRGLWWDDWFLIAGFTLITINAALVTVLIQVTGFGKHTWDFRPPDLNEFYILLQVRSTAVMTAIVWTKTAFAVTLLRLAKGKITRLIWVIIITMNVAMGTSSLLNWISCTPFEKNWNILIPGVCWNPAYLITYHKFSAGYSAAMDFVLAILPWKIILWEVSLRKREVVGVTICLSLGVCAGITAIVKTVYLDKLLSPDLYDSVDVFIWDVTEASVTLIAACIPVLRTLVKELGSFSHYTYTQRTTKTAMTHSPDHDSSNSIATRRLRLTRTNSDGSLSSVLRLMEVEKQKAPELPPLGHMRGKLGSGSIAMSIPSTPNSPSSSGDLWRVREVKKEEV